MINIDVIILSYSKDEKLKQITCDSVKSLVESENPDNIKFNILVIESNRSLAPYQFDNTTTIYPEEKFGFHRYLNIGLNSTSSPYVCLSNNDLIYHKNWASEIVKAMSDNSEILSATPYCPQFHSSKDFPKYAPPLEGYFGVMVGWCIFTKRELFNIIGPLDEKFDFWYCDSDYAMTLMQHKAKNFLISSSFVTHIGSETLKEMDKQSTRRLTKLPKIYYDYKWQHKSSFRFFLERMAFKFQMLLGL